MRYSWKRFVLKQNIQTAYIRATKGTTFEDGAFRDNWNGLKGTLIYQCRHAYHVLELDTDGTKQAEHFINAVGEDLSGMAYICSGGKTERTLTDFCHLTITKPQITLQTSAYRDRKANTA